MATPVLNRVLAIGAGLLATRVTKRVLRRATPRLAGGPILGPVVFFLASRYALPRVKQMTKAWTERRLNHATAGAPPPRAGLATDPAARDYESSASAVASVDRISVGRKPR